MNTPDMQEAMGTRVSSSCLL